MTDADLSEGHPGGNSRLRRTLLLLLLVIVLVAGLLWFLFGVVLATPSESTDDAYVAGDIIPVTARDAGTILTLHADDTQLVRAGAPLIDLDPTTADVALEAAAAELGRSVRATRMDFSRLQTSAAAVAEANARLEQAEADYRRRLGVAGTGAISGEELAHAADAVTVAKAALDVAVGQQTEARNAVSGTTLRSNPAVLAAIAAYRQAAIRRGHMHIVAPVDGIVAKRQGQLGQHIAAGTPLLNIVPLGHLWVDANLRETQLDTVRIGQPVKLTTDMYGKGVTYHGRVAGLDAGSGNAFALLPPQNASGNWIKIIQRLPVRITLDPKELEKNPLRVGLSVTATIDTSDRSGPRLGLAARAPYRSDVPLDPDAAAIDARINAIIAGNS